MLWDLRNKERNEAAAAAAAVSDAGQLIPTKVLRKFLASLTSRESPVLMDLGPVVGSNVTFLGERGNDSTVSFGTHFGSVVLDGGDGDDVLRGGDERTILRGGSGRDRLFGDLTPDGSSDRLRGGPGADSLHGMSGRDRLLGGTGIDENFGGQGSDLCRSPARGPRAHSCER